LLLHVLFCQSDALIGGIPRIKLICVLGFKSSNIFGIKVPYWLHSSCAEDKTEQERSFLGRVYAVWTEDRWLLVFLTSSLLSCLHKHAPTRNWSESVSLCMLNDQVERNCLNRMT